MKPDLVRDHHAILEAKIEEVDSNDGRQTFAAASPAEDY